LGEGDDFAESWEISDHGADQSIVAEGPYRGWELGRLVLERSAELLGQHAGLTQFPLLLKFLDARDRLSVQVHPNDEQARRFDPRAQGKTEAWVILAADPGSCLYAGLKSGIDTRCLEASLAAGTVEDCLHRLSVAAGDCLFIPAGTVHAIGEGVLLAEIQQTSDVTFRLFDWGRLGADGQPRPLHVEQSLACIDFSRGPLEYAVPRPVPGAGHAVEELFRCPYFAVRRHRGPAKWEPPPDRRCRTVMILDGSLTLRTREGETTARRGNTRLIPASAASVSAVADDGAAWLEVFWE
jgi:mannose-6-phosphate isomerase